ncbi:hypothetical protein GGI23_003562 [Coemansia sp. RSA 2559]|nr:hypothetical protein GGI23_003562 [Coemansia sp. RSA 2559]KAJ2859472.1 hypothetical protein GGI22_002978 [Coemansia erecta]
MSVAMTTFTKMAGAALIQSSKGKSPENILKSVNAMEEMAKEYSSTSGQLAIAWLLAQYDNLIIIPGTKRIKQLEANFAAGQSKLSSEELMEPKKLVDNANMRE